MGSKEKPWKNGRPGKDFDAHLRTSTDNVFLTVTSGSTNEPLANQRIAYTGGMSVENSPQEPKKVDVTPEDFYEGNVDIEAPSLDIKKYEGPLTTDVIQNNFIPNATAALIRSGFTEVEAKDLVRKSLQFATQEADAEKRAKMVIRILSNLNREVVEKYAQKQDASELVQNDTVQGSSLVSQSPNAQTVLTEPAMGITVDSNVPYATLKKNERKIIMAHNAYKAEQEDKRYRDPHEDDGGLDEYEQQMKKGSRSLPLQTGVVDTQTRPKVEVSALTENGEERMSRQMDRLRDTTHVIRESTTLAPKDVSITQLQANPEVGPMTPKERMDWLRDRTKSIRESTNMSHAEAMKTNAEFHTVRTNIRKIRNRLKQIENNEGNPEKQAKLQSEIKVLRDGMALPLQTFKRFTPRTFEDPYVDEKQFEISPEDIVSYTTEAGVTVQARVRSAMGSDLYGIEWQDNGKLTTMTVLRDAITFSKKVGESKHTDTSTMIEQSNTVEVPIPSVTLTDTSIVSESSAVQGSVDSKKEKVGTIASVRAFLAGWREKKVKNNEAQLAARDTVLNEKIIAIVSKRNKRARTVALAALLLLVGIQIGKQTNEKEDVSKPPTTIENVEKSSITKPAIRYEIPTYGNTVISPTKSPRIIDLKSGYQPALERVESPEKLTPQSQKNAALDKQYLDNPDAFIAKRGAPDLKDPSIEAGVSDSASEEFPPHPSNVENSEEERSYVGVDDAEYEEEEFPPHPSNIEVDDEGYEESQAVQVESTSPGSYVFPSGIGTNKFVDSIVSEFYTDNAGRFDAVGNTNSEVEYQNKAHKLLEAMRTYKTENAAVVQEMGISSGDIDNIKPGEVVNMNSFLALLKY